MNGSTTIAHPRLWGPLPQQRPHRYVAVTTLSAAGRTIDRYETRFGIRSIRFDPDKGIYVNDERIALNGVNNHHDLGALGAAFNYRAAERQLEMLQEMGANALRTAHNPPAPELLELTDRMGILVYEPDLRALLRRDRNHPSVILWSVGNEVGEQSQLELTADRAEIRADGLDLFFVTVRVADRHGLTAPRAGNRIRFSLEGPGEIVATGNGDPASFESFQSRERNAFNGYCLVIVK